LTVQSPLVNNSAFAVGDSIQPFINTHPIDNITLSDTAVSYNVRNNLGIYMYLDYTKGAETDITISFTIRDIKQSNLNLLGSEYSLQTVTSLTGLNSTYQLQLSASGLYMLPVNISESTEWLTANFVFTGSTAVAGGSVKVFVNTDINSYQ